MLGVRGYAARQGVLFANFSCLCSLRYAFQPHSTLCVSSRAYGVVVSIFDFHHSDRGSNSGRGGKIHNVYEYNIERHLWQVSENYMPRVHPSHVRESG